MAKRRKKPRKRQSSSPSELVRYPTLLPSWIWRSLAGSILMIYGGFSLITGIGFFPLPSSKMQPPIEMTMELSPGAARVFGAAFIVLGVWCLRKKCNKSDTGTKEA